MYQPGMLGTNYSDFGYSSGAYGGGSSGAAMKGGGGMDTMTAGAVAGGQFLSNYLAQRAAEEENRKKNLMAAELAKGEAAKNSGDMQNQAMANLMSAYRSALMGG